MRVYNRGLGPIRDIRHGFTIAEKVTFEWRPEGWAKISKVNVGAVFSAEGPAGAKTLWWEGAS